MDIQDHQLTLFADNTPGLPPEGKIEPVAGTPFDFTKPKLVGKDLKAAGSPGMDAPIGYDSNWIVNGNPEKMRPVARLEDPKSGRVMTVDAGQPGVQLSLATRVTRVVKAHRSRALGRPGRRHPRLVRAGQDRPAKIFSNTFVLGGV